MVNFDRIPVDEARQTREKATIHYEDYMIVLQLDLMNPPSPNKKTNIQIQKTEEAYPRRSST